MPVTSVEKNLDALTLTVIAEFPVPVRRLWDAYADPRQLESFWGPVEYPASFTRHDLMAGGRSHYFMTGPTGNRSHGCWEFVAVDPGRSFTVFDRFTDETGTPNTDHPTMLMRLDFDATESCSRVAATSQFDSLEELQHVLDMGVEEGLRSAMGQIDGVVADDSSFAADRPLDVRTLDDTRVRLSRILPGSPQQVWNSHHDTAVMRRWMAEPEGWEMPVCTVAEAIGDSYRFEWLPTGGGAGFGSTGELLEEQPPFRALTTERSTDSDGPGSINELTLREVEGGTLLTTVITYPSAERREQALTGGMPEGTEAGYVRLAQILRGGE